jgi:hypothetical protein
MQGLSLENMDGSQPLPTATPEGSPRQGEATVVTTPQVESTKSLEPFRITNTRVDFRILCGERPFVQLNSFGELVVTSSGSPVGPFIGVEGQDPFWSAGDFRRTLFSPGSPTVSEINPLVFSEIEIIPVNTTYHFTLPTGFTTAGLPPINTQRTPNVTPTLPPDYHPLNSLLNASNPTPPQTPSGTPGGPSGHPIPGFIPTLPQFPSGNPNPSGTIPSIAPNLQIPVGGQGGAIKFPLTGHNPITTQPTIGTELPVGTPTMIGGPTPPFGQNIPPALAQYWTQMLQNLPQKTGRKQPTPTIGQPYPGIPNPIWGQGQHAQTQTQGYNPWNYYPLQPPMNQSGSSHYGQTMYGPTSLPTGLPPQSHHYP